MSNIITMKRITKFNIVNIVLILTYTILVVLNVYSNFLFMNSKLFWFMAFLCLIGISLLFKFLIFKSDSSLWMSLTILLCAVVLNLIYYLKLDITKYYVTFLLSPIIASLFVGLIFKDVLQLKIATYILTVLIPLALFSFKIFSGIICILIFFIILVLVLFILNIFPRILYKINSKE